MFRKITAIEDVNLVEDSKKELNKLAKEVVMYYDVPSSDEEIIKRIGDSDAVLVSYTSKINAKIIESCPDIKYIGMCCSLYSEESANVDIKTAREHNISVRGIRDYGDRGVTEYVLHELTHILHGFYCKPYFDIPCEIYGLKIGFVGFGTSGQMTARALKTLGADVCYFCRNKKEEIEKEGMHFKDLKTLLETSQVVICCLNKNVLLLQEEQFKELGNGKILFNTSIGPGFDSKALEKWLNNERNIFCCDTKAAAGSVGETFFDRKNVRCPSMSAGRTIQAFELLSQKVIANIKEELSLK